MKVLGIAGPSGSGKSTIANFLAEKYREDVTMLSLDDYFVKRNLVPVVDGVENWEDYNCIRWSDFISDVKSILGNQSVKIYSKSKFYNSEFDYEKYDKKEVTVVPKKILILEGYLLFANEDVRNLIDQKIYLDIDVHVSLARRGNDKLIPDNSYIEKILLPSTEKWIYPNKKFADHVLDTLKTSTEKVLYQAEEIFLETLKK